MGDGRLHPAELVEDLVALANEPPGAVRSLPSSRAAGRADAASRRRPPGCPTCSRICSQRRIASATGVGPNTAADARQPRISKSSRSSPARRACVAARCHASSARPSRPSIQSIRARSRHARHWPRSSPCRRGARAPRRRLARVLVPAARSGVQAHELLVDAGARLEARVPLERGALDRLREEPVGVREPAGLDERGAERGQQLGAPGSSGASSATARSSSPAPAAASPRASAARAAVASRSAASAASARLTLAGGAELDRKPYACSRW